jgi:hypothetical protein
MPQFERSKKGSPSKAKKEFLAWFKGWYLNYKLL